LKKVFIAVALAAATVFAFGTLASADTSPKEATLEQHFYAHAHTNFGGFASIDLQEPVNPADVVVDVASGATHLGGEDPSFATVNFAGYVDEDTIRVRVIGWHANTVTGKAEFRYYSDKDVDIAVSVHGRTTAAAPTPANCRVSQAILEDRPDGGNHGIWAIDQLTRTTTICEGTSGQYHATVKDTGTFNPIEGALSPNAGVTIAGSVGTPAPNGTVTGGFTSDFTASPLFVTYDASSRTGTFTGSTPTTGSWVGGFFSDDAGADLNDDWSWTYKTCSEQWVDAFPSDGTLPADGDITGAPCPS